MSVCRSAPRFPLDALVEITRKFDRLMASTLLLAIICLFPLMMLVKPVAYPSTLENTKPSAVVRLPADVPLKVGWGGDKIEMLRSRLS
jgi:hypothetical protein